MKLRSPAVLTCSGACLVIFAAGCGAETGNGVASIRAGLSSSSPGGAGGMLAALDQQGSTLLITSASANVRDIELYFEAGTQCTDFEVPEAPNVRCEGGKLRFVGPFVFDLITQQARPSLDDLPIPAHTYRRADVRFDTALPADGLIVAGDPLNGFALISSGSFQRTGQSLTFDLAIDFNEQARFDSDQGITLAEGGASELLLNLDVASWFSNAPISQCLDDGDLTLMGTSFRIDDQSGRGGCNDVEKQIKDAIKTSGDLR